MHPHCACRRRSTASGCHAEARPQRSQPSNPVRPTAFALTTLLALGLGSTVHAQDGIPRVELHVGYAFLQDLGDEATDVPLGWSASLAWNPGRSLGLVLDVGGNYKSEAGNDFHEHALLAGLRYSLRGALTPYLEALAGAVVGSVRSGSVSVSATDFAVQGGTGLGLRLGERLSIRVGVDFRNIFSEGESFHQLRAVAGLSFGFGGGSAGRESVAPTLPFPPPSDTSGVETPAPRRPQTPPAPMETPPLTASEPSVWRQPADALELGHALLRRRDYARAADAFRDYLQYRASSRYTIAVGLFCDPSKAVEGAQDAGGAPHLILLIVPYRGRACYRVYWGLYDTLSAAEQAMSSIPAALRVAGQAPLPVSRLLP